MGQVQAHATAAGKETRQREFARERERTEKRTHYLDGEPICTNGGSVADNLASLRETSSKAMDAASMDDCIEKKNAAAAQVTGYYENHGRHSIHR